ncbi:MAG: FKBP-type peptidyl-prolyl cis-trans isomerase [Marinirhabdus sp.]
MNKSKLINFLLVCLTLVGIFACNNDDGNLAGIPPRDRAEEALAAQAEIEEFLETHYYNYEEFADPPSDFDYRIVFDTIAGDNASKTPLMEQVSSKTVMDRQDLDVTYTLYYLDAITGGGADLQFPDIATYSYTGRLLNDELTVFDSSTVPIQSDLTALINGFQDVLIEFNAATSATSNPDGTVSFENYGVGAAFLPSGLAYFSAPPPNSGIPLYEQLIFSFRLYNVTVGDQDNDGVISVLEDRNGNGIEEDDDTDGDTAPDIFDPDDDNDGRPTREEIVINNDGTVTYTDTDGDGTPDYLDPDS